MTSLISKLTGGVAVCALVVATSVTPAFAGSGKGNGGHRGGHHSYRGHHRGGHHSYRGHHGGRHHYRGYSYGYSAPYYGYGHGYYHHGSRHKGLGTALAILGVGVGVAAIASSSSRRADREVDYDNRGAVREPAYDPGLPPAAFNGANCLQTREYTTTVIIAGDEHEAYGTACLQPDGSWLQGPAIVAPN